MNKQFNCTASVTIMLVTLAAPVSVLAEAGAKSLFENEGTTIMRSDDSRTFAIPQNKP